MLSKHIDGIAVLAIVLALLMVTKMPCPRIQERLNAAQIHIQRAVGKIENSPLRRIVTRLAQEAR